ncbi:hypothetical protein D9M69_476950 [compost metagenome]
MSVHYLGSPLVILRLDRMAKCFAKVSSTFQNSAGADMKLGNTLWVSFQKSAIEELREERM